MCLAELSLSLWWAKLLILTLTALCVWRAKALGGGEHEQWASLPPKEAALQQASVLIYKHTSYTQVPWKLEC